MKSSFLLYIYVYIISMDIIFIIVYIFICMIIMWIRLNWIHSCKNMYMYKRQILPTSMCRRDYLW